MNLTANSFGFKIRTCMWHIFFSCIHPFLDNNITGIYSIKYNGDQKLFEYTLGQLRAEVGEKYANNAIRQFEKGVLV